MGLTSRDKYPTLSVNILSVLYELSMMWLHRRLNRGNVCTTPLHKSESIAVNMQCSTLYDPDWSGMRILKPPFENVLRVSKYIYITQLEQ